MPKMVGLAENEKQMIKYKGTTLFPPAIFEALHHTDAVQNFVVEVNKNEFGNDDILIKIGCDDIPDGFEKTIKNHFRATIRVAPEISFHSTKEIAKIMIGESNSLIKQHMSQIEDIFGRGKVIFKNQTF